MSPPAAGCCHVTGFKVENWKQNLRAIYQCFVWSGSAETRKRKVPGAARIHPPSLPSFLPSLPDPPAAASGRERVRSPSSPPSFPPHGAGGPELPHAVPGGGRRKRSVPPV